MRHVADGLVDVPELGVEEPGEAFPLLQPASATTNTNAAIHLIPAVCRIRSSSDRFLVLTGVIATQENNR